MSRISFKKIGLWNNAQTFAFDFTLYGIYYSVNLKIYIKNAFKNIGWFGGFFFQNRVDKK